MIVCNVHLTAHSDKHPRVEVVDFPPTPTNHGFVTLTPTEGVNLFLARDYETLREWANALAEASQRLRSIAAGVVDTGPAWDIQCHKPSCEGRGTCSCDIAANE